MAGELRITPYTRQTGTPGVTVSDGNFRVPDQSAPFRALEQAGAAISETAMRESARRDELDLMKYEQALSEADTAILIGDGETPGALKTQGTQAQDVTKNTLGLLDEKAKSLLPELRTNQARAKAQQMAAVRRQDAEKRLTLHEFDQGRVADLQVTEASLTQYRNEAIANATDPMMVDAAIARSDGVIAAHGRRIGESPELTAQKIAANGSALLRDVISSQLTQDPSAALATYKTQANRLMGSDALDVERAMQPYVLDIQSNALGDSDWNGTAPTVAVGSASVYDAIALTESGGRQFDDAGRPIRGPVTSNGARAVGQFQIMPATGPEAARLAGEVWNESRLANDADYNARLGRAYLDAQIKRFNGHIPVVAAAYNMGPVAAEKWAAGVPYQTQSGKWWRPKAPMDLSAMPDETRKYIGKVTKRMGGRSSPNAVAMPSDQTELGIAEREVMAIESIEATETDMRLREGRINRVQQHALRARKLLQARQSAAEVNKAEFKNNYNNVVAKLSDGVDVPIVDRPTQEQLVAMYGAEGDRMYREMNTYSAAAPAVAQLKTATVTEAGAILSKFKPDPKSDNYAFESKFYQGLVGAFAEQQKARNADPAQFLLSNSKAVSEQYAGVVQGQAELMSAKTPEDQQIAAANMAKRGQAFTDVMMAEQDRLGVPYAQRKLLPTQAVAEITGQFDALVAEGKVADASTLIRYTVGKFGDGAAVAITQLGQNAGPVLRMTLEGIDPRTTETFIAANATGEKVLKDSMGNDAWNQMGKAVRTQLAALDATGTSEYPAYLDMTTKVAAMKVRSGMDPNQAAQQAAAETINGRYLFAGQPDKVTYRVPLATPQGNPIDAQSVVRGAEFTLDRLSPADIAVGEAIPPGVPVELYKQYRVERIQRTGQWRTLGDESGLELQYQDDAGRLIPVRNADGTTLRLPWSQLQTKVPREVSIANDAVRATLRGTR